MRHDSRHHRLGHYFDLPPRWGWIAWLVVVFGVIGVTIALWPNPLPLMIEICVVAAALIIMAVLVYGFDLLVFRATQPRPEDLPTLHDDDHAALPKK